MHITKPWYTIPIWYVYRLIVALVSISVLTIAAAGCGALDSRGTVGPATASAEDLRPLPNLTVDPRDLSFLTATAKGVYRSGDGGQAWAHLPIPESLGRSSFTQILLARDTPTVVYVSGRGVGVIQSEDGGQNWQGASNGLPSQDVGALTLHGSEPDTLFAWVRNEGIYRTEDRGASWRFMHEGPDIKNLTLLLHSPLEGSMGTG